MSVCKYKFLIILIIIFLYLIYLYKNTEGFNDDFSNYTKTLPNSFIYNSASTKYNHIFSFYKGKGTYKREKIKDTGSDEKLSILNKLLDKLLNRITSDSQDCVGDFDKYSECDKLCGSGGFQTRKYVITQEKGINGKECPYEDGYKEKISCFLKDCGEGSECEKNRDCRSRNCDPKDKKCGLKVECTKETTHVCDENECRRLNEDYSDASHLLEGKYLYNKRNKQCFFKTPAEMEKLNVNLYTYNYENPDDYTYKDDTCAYYQQLGEGGECVNSDRINLVGGEPKCELGWKPEPTYFNASYACQKCNGTRKGINCVCGDNKVFNKNGDCVPGEENITGLCEGSETKELMIQPDKDAECKFCEYNEKFVKEQINGLYVASCIPCPEGYVTERAVGGIESDVLPPDERRNESMVIDESKYNYYVRELTELTDTQSIEDTQSISYDEKCNIDLCNHYSGPGNPLKKSSTFHWPESPSGRAFSTRSDIDGGMCTTVDAVSDCPYSLGLKIKELDEDGELKCVCIPGMVEKGDKCVPGCAEWTIGDAQIIPPTPSGEEGISISNLEQYCDEKNLPYKFSKLMCDARGELYGLQVGQDKNYESNWDPINQVSEDHCGSSCSPETQLTNGECAPPLPPSVVLSSNDSAVCSPGAGVPTVLRRTSRDLPEVELCDACEQHLEPNGPCKVRSPMVMEENRTYQTNAYQSPDLCGRCVDKKAVGWSLEDGYTCYDLEPCE